MQLFSADATIFKKNAHENMKIHPHNWPTKILNPFVIVFSRNCLSFKIKINRYLNLFFVYFD